MKESNRDELVGPFNTTKMKNMVRSKSKQPVFVHKYLREPHGL